MSIVYIESRVGEIGLWQSQAEKLQIRRDRLVGLSIPGWVSMAVILPKFLNEILNSNQPVEPWLKIAAPLSILAGWGIFEAAEYIEKSRLRILAKLERAGADISTTLTAGKFPWVRHFVDNEPPIRKIARLFGKI